MSKDGKYVDQYVSGPVKNTITKHASEIQKCYNAFLERIPAILFQGTSDFEDDWSSTVHDSKTSAGGRDIFVTKIGWE